MTTELIANSPTPGTQAAITTLAAAITSTSATTITTAAASPTALQGGQFRIVIDSEIMIVTAGQTGTSWTVTRGAEGSTATTHSNGASVFHDLTAGALDARYAQSAPAITGTYGTSLGSAQTMNLVAGQDQWLAGLMTTGLTVTVATFPAGSKGKLFAQMDGSAPHSLTVAVTGGGTTVLNPPETPSGTPFEVLIESVDGTAANVTVTPLYNADAGTSVKGAVMLDTAPAVAYTPEAVGSNSPWISQSVYLASNATAVNNSTAFVNAGTLAFSIGASATEAWEAEFWVLINGTSTMDAQFQLATAPSGATALGGIVGGTVGGWATGGPSATPNAAVGFTTAVQIGMPTSGTTGVYLKWVVFGGGTAGTVQLQYAQVTATAANLQVLAGSYVKYRKLQA